MPVIEICTADTPIQVDVETRLPNREKPRSSVVIE